MHDALALFTEVAHEKIYLQTEEVGEDAEEVWKKRLSDNSALALFAVAYVYGTMAGCLVLNPESSASKNAHVRNLGMWVGKNFRGRGVGGALLDYAVQWAKYRTDVRKIVLGVYSSNERAEKLYRSRGFQIEWRIKDNAFISGRYADELIMSLDVA